MRTLFYLAYSFLLFIAWVVMIPYLLYLSQKAKYKKAIPARFFLYKNPPFLPQKIWIHACSFGEVRALEFLSKELNTPLNISVITQTGFNAAREYAKEVRFLPFEIFLPFWVKKHDLLIVMEAELWLMLFLTSKIKKSKTVLLNGRISDNSYKKYLKWRWFYGLIFENVDMVFAQSKEDKKRLESLGAKNVKVSGNIKTATTPMVKTKLSKPKNRVLTLASTHENEEEMLLKKILPEFKNEKIILAPRHPERFKKVEELAKNLAKEHGLTFAKLSEASLQKSDILLCDRLGELNSIYAITDIAFLGGSFVENVGGHNPLEPAFFENVIISGAYFFNQKTLYESVENIYIADINEVPNLLKSELKRSKISKIEAKELIIKELKSLMEKI
ncbi:MAG: lipid IV(A) 3-deoxy-D-manno-octulosonic acid transferase [Sulfurospirillaceae bacterium]|nr:lipid IV(A) 3-deoxy-D-manno-octulosonic acid transferase [Sulfurospirillaceae bacterium]MCK9545397.1 lipid IV(A) 3-deoxy-D-manno-octulosonic acid transferase [Sulfurospirillaceae bacterium]